jgi:class 3 adenylate cyclase
MGPKQKMTSVTHNATEANKSKPKGLWKTLRRASISGSTPPASSDLIEQAARQMTNIQMSQSLVAPKSAVAQNHARVVAQSFNSWPNSKTGNVDIDELKRQPQQQHQMLQHLQKQEKITKQQHQRSQSYDRERSNSYGRTRSDGQQKAQVHRNRPQRNSHSDISANHQQSKGGHSETSAARALANLTISDQYEESFRRRGSNFSASQSSRRRSSMMSEDSYVYNEKYDDTYNEGLFSVMAEQRPPPDRANRSFTSSRQVSSDHYTPQSTSGNPSWFSEESTLPQCKGENGLRSNGNMYGAKQHSSRNVVVDDYTTTTTRTCWSDSTAASSEAERSAQSTPGIRSNIEEYAETLFPKGEVTIVHAFIQGSASLWETHPNDMIEAHDVYDIIMRRSCSDHFGYEISSTRSSFVTCFQNPIDAFAFALEAQTKLYSSTSWPDGIMKSDNAKFEPALKFNGLRVSIALHHGPVTISTPKGKPVYRGETVEISKAIGDICHGGQILATIETWDQASGIRARCLGMPQAMDCGEHFLFEALSNGSSVSKKICKRLVQLVPQDLAFDFGAARGRIENDKAEDTIKNASAISGRLFPPVQSKKQLSTSFLNAPYRNGRVTLCVVQAVGINDESEPSIKSHNLKLLTKCVNKQLLQISPPGYESRADNGQWILAFDRMMSGVMFGLQLKSAIHEVTGLRGDVNKECMFKIGIVTGAFESMSVS